MPRLLLEHAARLELYVTPKRHPLCDAVAPEASARGADLRSSEAVAAARNWLFVDRAASTPARRRAATPCYFQAGSAVDRARTRRGR